MHTNGTYNSESIIPTGEGYDEHELLTFEECMQLEAILPLTYESIADRIIADRVRKKLLPSDAEKAALGFTRHANGRWHVEEKSLAERYRKPIELGETGWAFVRHRLKDVLKKKIESDEQRLGWNSEPIWALFDKFGLLEKAVDKVVEEGEIPAADFIVGYLEKAGALDDLDLLEESQTKEPAAAEGEE